MGFLIRRIVFYLVAFFVAITVNFSLPRMMPGDPFEIMFGIKSVGDGDVGYAIGAGSLWPLIVLDSLLRKFGRKNKGAEL